MPRRNRPVEDNQQHIRIPLIGTYNTRTFDSSTGFGVLSGVVGVGIVGSMIVGSLFTGNRDQRFVNCFPETIRNPITNKVHYYLTKRPGFDTHTTPAAGNIGTAIKVWLGQGSGTKIMSAFGDTNSTIYDGTSSIGTTVGVARDITETNATGTATLVIPCENGNAYYYPDGGALTQITDVDFPSTNIGTFVHMDGYAFIMTTLGDIYNSDLNSISSWSADNFVSASQSTDQGVGLIRFRNYIVAFGKESAELFWNAGNPTGSPLTRIDNGFIRIGAISSRAMCTVENNIYWVSSSDGSSYAVYTMDGTLPRRISSPQIETYISILAPNGSVDLTGVRLFGKTFIFVQVSGPATFVYVVEDDMWHEWSGTTRLWYKFTGNTATSNLLHSISRDGISGKIYKMTPSNLLFTDDGTSYVMQLQTSKFDADNNYNKFGDRLELIGDKQVSTTNIVVDWTDDDYNTYADGITLDMSQDNPVIYSLGSFRRRAFRLTNESSTPVRIEALELDYRQGIR